MIIGERAADEVALVGVQREDKFASEKIIFTHCQDVAPIIRNVQLIKANTDRGFTDKRLFQHTGSIPQTIWLRLEQKYPEMKTDPKVMEKVVDKFLASEEGAPYRICDNKKISGSGMQLIIR